MNVGAPVVIGTNPDGTHRMIPIIGGTFEGPKLSGKVMPGGADWQRLRPDGVLRLEAHYVLETDQGARISVVNRGLRHVSKDVAERIARGELVAAHEYYFRAAPTFEVESGELDWLTRTLFISTGERQADLVVIRVWAVE